MNTFITIIVDSLNIPEFRMAVLGFSIFLLVGGMFAIISNRKLISHFSYKRALNSFLLILFLQALLLIYWVLIYFGNDQLGPYQNILSEIVFGISSLWLIWLWCFPSSTQSADGIKYAITIALLIVFCIQLFIIPATEGVVKSLDFYNEILLFLLILIILFSGFLLLLINHKSGWFWGLLFVTLLISGLFFSKAAGIDSTSRPGIIFFTQLASFILLPSILQSFIFSETSPDSQQPGYRLTIASKEMSILPALNVYKSWLNLAIKNQDSLILDEFLKNISNTFQCDYCFLLSPIKPGQDQLSIYSGHSTKKRIIEFPIILESKSNPTLFHHLKNGESCIANPEDYLPDDISNLLRYLKIEQPIHMLFFPIRTRLQPNNIFGLALLSSQTIWDRSHLKYLSGIDDELVQIMQKIFPKKINANPISSNLKDYSKQDEPILLNNIHKQENQTQKIIRLESELKFALEEYARIKRLLEERNILGDYTNKNR